MRRGLFVCGFSALVAMAWSLSATAFPDPIGDCIGADCPTEPYDPPNNGDFIGSDEAINVFVGGNMNVVAGAAESEGKLVALGNLDVSRSSAGSYNIGVVGAGSRITPPSGSDHAIIGGDITVEDSPLSTIHLGGSDGDETRWGNLVYGGDTTISQGDRLDLTPNGLLIDGGPTVTDPYAALRGTITGISNCAETYEDTGTWESEFGTATFTGDGTSMLQVFTVPADLGTSGQSVQIAFAGIPDGATTVINMVGVDPNVYLNSTALPIVSSLHTRLVWNFPNADTAGIRGSAQVPGSILVGPTTSTTTITTPGTNGRVLLAGNLVHGGGGGGEEMHAYPFNGTLPPCEPAEDVADADTDTESDVDTDVPADVADIGTDTESDVDTDVPADVADFGTDTESDVDTDVPADVADFGTDTESDVDTDVPADVADFGTDTESDVDTDVPADVADFGTDTESDVDTDQPADVADLGTDTDGDSDTDDAADDSDGGGVDPGEGEALPDTGADRYAPLLAALGAASLLAGTAITRRARRSTSTHRA
jgi:choice-of-anchor A domain-containing protein